jgi:hypothetical protein
VSVDLWAWLTPILATDAPLLPTGAMVWTGMRIAWSVVIVWIGVTLYTRWWPAEANTAQLPRWAVAALLAAWAWLPGPYASAYWLGLAFQMPSLSTVLLCSAWLFQNLAGTGKSNSYPTRAPSLRAMAMAGVGVLAGWALLLDTLAILPVQLYAAGFSPLAAGLAMVCALMALAVGNADRPPGASHAWVVPAALVLFVACRLPTGNMWDAVLDPWLWVALQVYWIRQLVMRYKNRSKVSNTYKG